MRKINEIMARLKDQRNLEKWCIYAQYFGVISVDWHETWYYTASQERFFSQYEAQMREPVFKSRLINRRAKALKTPFWQR